MSGDSLHSKTVAKEGATNTPELAAELGFKARLEQDPCLLERRRYCLALKRTVAGCGCTQSLGLCPKSTQKA